MTQASIPLSQPSITDAERTAVLEVLQTPSLSLGPKLPEFEQAICDRTGARYAIAVNSGTSGLHLCVKGLGIGFGDEVITTPFSFIASANCILYEQAKPVFVDIDPHTMNLDPERIEAAITPRTKAILPVHVFGRPCDMKAIQTIARRHGLAVIEDSCEALGAVVNGRAAGTLGDAGVYAFYPNKQITTGEGGVIVTDDVRLAELCRSWRNQGRGSGSGWLQHERLGYNYRLSDLNCALGIAQLKRLDEIISQRARVARLYHERLSDMEFIIAPRPDQPGDSISWFVYVVRLADEFGFAERDRVLADLRARGIGCSNYFTPIHLQPFYRDEFGFSPGAFPIAEFISERTIALPFHAELTEAEVERVCSSLQAAIESVCEEIATPA